MTSLNKKINNKDIFFAICFACLGLFFLYAFVFGPHMFDWLDMENNSTWTSIDHYLSIVINDNISVTYSETKTQYPPLACLIYSVFARMLGVRGKTADYYDATAVSQYPYAQMLYVPYMCLSFLLFVYAISELKLEKKYKVALSVVLLFSTPMFAGGMERGNLVLIAAGLLCIACVWMNSEMKWKQEAALLLIAVSAGLKIYPALIGLLYIKKKDWKNAIKLVIYGLIFFFVPFVFFEKGAIFSFVKNLINTQGGDYYGRITHFAGAIVTLGVSQKISGVFNLIFIILLLACFFATESNVRRLFYVVSMMIFVPSNQFRYMLLFLAIPMFSLFEESEELSLCEKWVDTVLLALVFAIPWPFGMLNGFSLEPGIGRFVTWVEIFIYFPAYVLLFMQFVFEAYSCWNRFDKNKGTDCAKITKTDIDNC